MPLPLTVSCFSKIQIGFAFLVPAHPGSPTSPGKRAVKRVCVCVCVLQVKQVWKEAPIEGGQLDYLKFVTLIKRGKEDE